jgi:hypothetical protein
MPQKLERKRRPNMLPLDVAFNEAVASGRLLAEAERLKFIQLIEDGVPHLDALDQILRGRFGPLSVE